MDLELSVLEIKTVVLSDAQSYLKLRMAQSLNIVKSREIMRLFLLDLIAQAITLILLTVVLWNEDHLTKATTQLKLNSGEMNLDHFVITVLGILIKLMLKNHM